MWAMAALVCGQQYAGGGAAGSSWLGRSSSSELWVEMSAHATGQRWAWAAGQLVVGDARPTCQQSTAASVAQLMLLGSCYCVHRHRVNLWARNQTVYKQPIGMTKD